MCSHRQNCRIGNEAPIIAAIWARYSAHLVHPPCPHNPTTCHWSTIPCDDCISSYPDSSFYEQPTLHSECECITLSKLQHSKAVRQPIVWTGCTQKVKVRSIYGYKSEPAYFTYFKGAESQKTGTQVKLWVFYLLICILKWPPNCLSCSSWNFILISIYFCSPFPGSLVTLALVCLRTTTPHIKKDIGHHSDMHTLQCITALIFGICTGVLCIVFYRHTGTFPGSFQVLDSVT